VDKNELISSGILELYATGIASTEESKMVEEYLFQYPELKKELNQIELALENYATSYSEKPHDSVKQNLLNRLDFKNDQIKETKSESRIVEMHHDETLYKPENKVGFNFSYLAAASLLLLIGSVIFGYTYYNKYQHASSNLVMAQEQLEKQQKSTEALSSDLDIMTNKNALPVVLRGTSKMPEAVARLFWMKTTGDVYIDPSNLPGAPADKQYQLWAIVDGKPIDAGIISKDIDDYRIQKMKSFGKVDAFAITLEKTGGSVTPTMDEMVVSVKM
jgi:anti-sigma-K factor RskA